MNNERNNFDLYDPKFVHFEWDPSLEGLDGSKVILADDIYRLKATVRVGWIADSGCTVAQGSCSYPFELGDAQWKFLYYDPDFELKAAWKQGKKLQFKSKIDGGWCSASSPCWGKYEFRIKPEEEKASSNEVCEKTCCTCKWDYRGDHCNDPAKHALAHCTGCEEHAHWEKDTSPRRCETCAHFGNCYSRCNQGYHNEWEPAESAKTPPASKEMKPFDNTKELVDFYNTHFMRGLAALECTMPFIWIAGKVTGCRQLVTSYNSITVATDSCVFSMKELFNQFTFLDGSPIGKEVVHDEEEA